MKKSIYRPSLKRTLGDKKKINYLAEHQKEEKSKKVTASKSGIIKVD